MTDWPTLAHAPVVEGLIDIRIERSGTVDFEHLRAFSDSLAREFPAREEIKQFSGQFTFSSEGVPTVEGGTTGPIGFLVRSADRGWAAQFRVDGCTVSRLAPYTSWNDLVGQTKRLWGLYRNAIGPAKVTRLAVRFINSIAFPAGDQFDQTFRTTFQVAPELPQAVAGFFLRFVVPFPSSETMAIVTQSLHENSNECTFDIDAFTLVPDGTKEEELWTRIEVLRATKNQLFFRSLTDDAIRRFE